ncbi:MAG: putative manganese-dependent inorganic diphosphatase [Firmicutes bacterium]|nr:putative manganese-dependent inorganic diphosphatase [Bacillota bacterium]
MLSQNDDIYVFGHKNPDTDSICSAIAYANLKGKTAKAYRLGDISKETEFVLNYFDVPVPPLLQDIRVKVGDLQLYEPETLTENQPVKMAWDMLVNSDGSRIIPIMSSDSLDSKKVKGIVAMGDVTEIFMEVSDEDIVKRHEILYRNLITILNGVEIGGKYKYEKLNGSLYIGTNFPDDIVINDNDVVITGKIDNAWRLAYEYNFGCIILTNGIKPKGLEGAKCAIVCVEYSMFKAVSLVSQAISLGSLVNTGDITTFSVDNYVDDISEIMRTSKHRNFPVVDEVGQIYGIISRRHLISFAGKKVILVDHNERSQSVDGLSQAEITEIIDHHRIADIQTDSPLYIRSEPVGCTSTIINKIYQESGVTIPQNIAGLMLSAILSDTLMFSSPTCTATDKLAAEQLAAIAKVDIKTYGSEMFSAGTSLEKYSNEQLLALDRKRFVFGKTVAYISQINTLDFANISAKIEDILNEMDNFYNANDCPLVILLITDIIAGGSEILAIGKEKRLVEKAFNLPMDKTHIFLPGVVSRKKQIVPILTQLSTIG